MKFLTREERPVQWDAVDAFENQEGNVTEL